MGSTKSLEEDFWKHVEIGNNLPPQTADNMLIAYAYYKQATEGDNQRERPKESSSIIQAFKHDAWKRLEGLSKTEAMKKYIDLIREFKKSQSK